MSKKFDEEYLTFLRDSTPDMWEKIEKNLKENPEREMPEKKKRSISKKISYFALPVAACILIAVFLPIWLGSTRMGSDEALESANSNMAVDSAPMELSRSAENIMADEEGSNQAECYEDADCAEDVCEEAVCEEACQKDSGVEVSEMLSAKILDSRIEIISIERPNDLEINQETRSDLQMCLAKIIWNAEGVLVEGSNVILYVEKEGVAIRESVEYHVIMEEKEDGYLVLEIIEEN